MRIGLPYTCTADALVRLTRRLQIILRTFLFLGIVLLPTLGETATITVGPADCSSGAVNNAITSANDGDTVILTCTGIATWSSTVTIPNTKGITLQVAGGTYTPPPGTFPLLITCTTGANPCLQMNIANGNAVARVTGFHFTDNFAPSNGAVFVQGQGLGPRGVGSFRIDNNFFDTFQVSDPADLQGTVTVWGLGPNNALTGLIDHNHFLDSSYTDSYVIAIEERWQYSGKGWPYAGQNAWTRPLGWGTSDFIFIEDNFIEQQTRYARHLIAAIQGGKWVARYNTFTVNKNNGGTQAEVNDAHGFCFCQSIGHGTRGGEIYKNIYSGTQVYNYILLRGGTWVVYDNTFLNPPSGNYIFLREYRAGNSTMHNQCDSSCPSDPTWFNGATDASHYPMHEQIGFNLAGQSEPSYFWNNTYQGINRTPTVDSAGVQQQYIQLNRDYYVQSTPPGYTSYTYPHPLVSGSIADKTPPAAPTELRVN